MSGADDAEGFIIHRRARAGGPRCGFREPLDKLRGAWGDVTCPACLALRGLPEDEAAALPAPTSGPAGPAGPGGRRPKRPEELPPQLVGLCDHFPRLIVVASGRNVEDVRRAFTPAGAPLVPEADPVHGCAVALAVALDWYLPDVLESPGVGAGLAVLGLIMAIKMTAPAVKEGES